MRKIATAASLLAFSLLIVAAALYATSPSFHAASAPAMSVPVHVVPLPSGSPEATAAPVLVALNSPSATENVSSSSPPTIDSVSVSPQLIPAASTTTITVTTQITDQRLIVGSVNLLLLNGSGGQPTILGQLQANGDGAYSIQVPIANSSPGTIELQVSAAFRGLLRRVLSNVISVNAWEAISDHNTHISLLFPPMSTQISVTSTAATTGGPATLDVEAFDNVEQDFIPVLGFAINQNSGDLNLRDWFERYIDIGGVLLSSGAAQQETLGDGATMIIVLGPIPPQYPDSAGPLADAYLMLPSSNEVVVVAQPQDSALADLSVSPQSLFSQLPAILGSVTVNAN
jgi:hypothetical protein